MIDNPLITIVVPIYNVEKFIVKCVQSILRQTYGNFELLLIDDSSPDSSAELCRQFLSDNRIVYIKKENGGLSSVRNLGIKLAKGAFIVFIDGDDWVENSYLELLVTPMLNSADLSVCAISEDYYSNNEITKSTINGIQSHTYWLDKDKIDFINVFPTGIMNSSCNKCFNLNIIRSNELIYSNIPIVEDFYFLLDYVKYVKKISFVDKALYHYIKNENVISLTSKVSVDMFDSYFLVHNALLSYIGNLPCHEIVNNTLFSQYYSLIIRILKSINEKKVDRSKYLSVLNEMISHPLIKETFDTYSPVSFSDSLLFNLIRKKKLRLALLMLSIL